MNDNYILHNGELYHWGVLGMKWGRRKGSTSTTESAPSNKPKTVAKEEPSTTKNDGTDPVIAKKHAKNIIGTVAVLAGTNCVASILKSKGNKQMSRAVRKYGTIASGLMFASGLFDIKYTKATGDKNERVRDK